MLPSCHWLRIVALLLVTLVAADAVPEIVSGPWCGAVMPDSIAVTVHVNGPAISTRLAVSTAANFTNPVYSPAVNTAAASGNNVRLDFAGLAPDTTYFYAIELNGVLKTAASQTGTFRTLPPPGPASFRFGFSSCGDWHESGQDVHHAILAENLRFFIHMGDLNYEDTDEDDPEPYRSNYINSLTESTELGDLVRKLPTSYIWDDHDFSGNTSDRTSDGRTAHRQVYREMVPHYPLPAGGPDAAIFQAFTCGRVRFLLSDLRSERNPDGDDDDASKSMMGTAQKQWFKNQLVAAREAEAQLIVWMSGVPLISSSSTRDNWGSYQTERTELLEFIRDEDIRNIVVISGDMHALAYDDGTATDSYVDGVHIPVFHAAALTRDGSEKGGPYSGGVSEGDGRYGILDIADNGTALSATYLGRIASSATAVSTWKSFTYQTAAVRPRPALAVTAGPDLSTVRVNWTDNSGVETGYRIERRPAGSGSWAAVGTTGAGATGFSDPSVSGVTAYDYRVVTLNGTAEAAPSNIATATSSNVYRNWKQLKLGNPNASDTADHDHDGLTTVDEYLFDLNPLQIDRYAWQVSPPTAGQVTVTFPTSTGRSYRVQFSHDLSTWSPGSPETTGNGTAKQWIDNGSVTGSPPPSGGKRFYRVAVSELH